MADVFISYSQRSVEPTKVLAQQLAARGIEVWWDTRLTSGQRFNDAIREELEAADAVIVIWSPQSVTSQYVKLEAGIAYAWEKLVTVRTPDLPFASIPAPFRALHTDLVSDTDRIMVALEQYGVQPRSASKSAKLSKDEILAAIGQRDSALPPALDRFLRKCQEADFRLTTKKSLMIKAYIPNFGEINFGTIFPDGRLQTNYISDFAERVGDESIARDYLDGVAALIDGAIVRRDGKSWTWRVELYGEIPPVSRLIGRDDQWIDLMKVARGRFCDAAALRARQSY
jgi:hypothetical protein